MKELTTVRGTYKIDNPLQVDEGDAYAVMDALRAMSRSGDYKLDNAQDYQDAITQIEAWAESNKYSVKQLDPPVVPFDMAGRYIVVPFNFGDEIIDRYARDVLDKLVEYLLQNSQEFFPNALNPKVADVYDTFRLHALAGIIRSGVVNKYRKDLDIELSEVLADRLADQVVERIYQIVKDDPFEYERFAAGEDELHIIPYANVDESDDNLRDSLWDALRDDPFDADRAILVNVMRRFYRVVFNKPECDYSFTITGQLEKHPAIWNAFTTLVFRWIYEEFHSEIVGRDDAYVEIEEAVSFLFSQEVDMPDLKEQQREIYSKLGNHWVIVPVSLPRAGTPIYDEMIGELKDSMETVDGRHSEYKGHQTIQPNTLMNVLQKYDQYGIFKPLAKETSSKAHNYMERGQVPDSPFMRSLIDILRDIGMTKYDWVAMSVGHGYAWVNPMKERPFNPETDMTTLGNRGGLAVYCNVALADKNGNVQYAVFSGAREKIIAARAHLYQQKDGGRASMTLDNWYMSVTPDKLIIDTHHVMGNQWAMIVMDTTVDPANITPKTREFFLMKLPNMSDEEIILQFALNLDRISEVPFMEHWGEYLWEMGTASNLINPSMYRLGNLSGWMVDASSPKWRSIVEEGIKSGAISFYPDTPPEEEDEEEWLDEEGLDAADVDVSTPTGSTEEQEDSHHETSRTSESRVLPDPA